MSDEPEKTFTLQETFDMAVGSVIRQGGPSVRPSPTPQHGFGCAYRGNGGRKCAAGQCIPDDKYDLSMEGASINSLRQLQRQPIKGHDLVSKTNRDICFCQSCLALPLHYHPDEHPYAIAQGLAWVADVIATKEGR